MTLFPDDSAELRKRLDDLKADLDALTREQSALRNTFRNLYLAYAEIQREKWKLSGLSAPELAEMIQAETGDAYDPQVVRNALNGRSGWMLALLYRISDALDAHETGHPAA